MSEAPAVDLPENVDQLVDQYVRLRDKLKAADDAHKKKTEQARAYLMMLNGKLLERLSEVGGESVKTPHGTVYQTTKRSASIADGDAFREYVINNGEFDLVDWRANSNAVDDYIKEHGAVPPGVNFSTMLTVGVRRPNK
jgi:hypothetical protein